MPHPPKRGARTFLKVRRVTLEELQKFELELMRAAFERACEIAGLPLQLGDDARATDYAWIAYAVQDLVEQGGSDIESIAGYAAATLGPRGFDAGQPFQFPL